MNRLLKPFTREPDDQVEMLDPEAEDIVASPYEVRDSRPWTQLAVRIGLWTAVGFGCLGGILALFGLTTREGDTVVVEGGANTSDELPGPVTAVAERGVREWLAGDDPAQLQTLFVEPPATGDESRRAGGHDIRVGAVTPLAGGRWEDSYWLVTMAVDVVECLPEGEAAATRDARDGEGSGDGDAPTDPDELGVDCPEPGDEDGDAGEDPPEPTEPVASTWYVEVGVVGDVEGRLAVLSTPSVVPAPPEVSPEWASSGRGADTPAEDEPVAQLVQSFLDAWLAGAGDAGPLLAPGADLRSQDPPPFAAVELVAIAYDQEEAGAPTDVRALADVTTRGGDTLQVGYELRVAYRDDRWEVVEYWGAPSLAGRPPPPEPEVPQAPEGEEADGGVSTTEDTGEGITDDTTGGTTDGTTDGTTGETTTTTTGDATTGATSSGDAGDDGAGRG